jgi:hypothetical protein
MSETYWKSEREWVCPKHLPSVKLPSNIEKCFFSGCSSLRPQNRPGNSSSVQKRVIIKPPSRVKEKNIDALDKKSVKVCAWFKCDKGSNMIRATVRSNSKYCSRDCSNRNARWRHKQRKN